MALLPFKFFRYSAFLMLLGGCASQVTHSPAQFTPAAQAGQQVIIKTLAQPADIQLDTGYRRILKEGSQWMRIGTVPQGDVYKPYKDVLTLEGAHVHEAYLIVSGDQQLVGFYLPVERGLSPLAKKIWLYFN